MPPDESAIIDRFFRPLAGEGAFGLLDDAGRLRVRADCDLVVTTDMIARGIHFLPGDPPDAVARKALRVNLSDLAAKGARPLAYTLGLGIGPDFDDAWYAEFAEGLRTDQERFSIDLLGGDTISTPEGPVISVTAFGLVPKGRMVHRFGGNPGDALYVSGTIGMAAAGLAILKDEDGPWRALSAEMRDEMVRAFRVPEPRVSLAPALVTYASAAMDVSDGLVGDCDKLAAASACAARIDAEKVPVPAGLVAEGDAEMLGRLLTAGDDYEVLAAIAPVNEPGFRKAAEAAGVVMTRIGTLVETAAATDVRIGGRPLPLARRGYVHAQGRGEA